jgi:hypothetical protein
VLPCQCLQLPLIQKRERLYQNESQVPLHQPHRDSIPNRFQNTNAGGVGDGLLLTLLLLFGLPFRLVAILLLLRMVYRASGIRADLVDAADITALGNDGVRGEFAYLELWTFCFLLALRLLIPDGGVLIARENLAAFLLLAVGSADLDELRLCGDLLGDVPANLRLIAIRVGALCGIRETGKCFLRARHGGASRLRSAHQGEGMNHGAGDWII